MPSEQSGEGGRQRLTFQQETGLLMVWMFASVGLVFAQIVPETRAIVPNWLPGVMLMVSLVWFFAWASKGGVPPR